MMILVASLRFAHAAKELEVEAIIGAELTLEDDSHLVLLAEELAGLQKSLSSDYSCAI